MVTLQLDITRDTFFFFYQRLCSFIFLFGDGCINNNLSFENLRAATVNRFFFSGYPIYKKKCSHLKSSIEFNSDTFFVIQFFFLIMFHYFYKSRLLLVCRESKWKWSLSDLRSFKNIQIIKYKTKYRLNEANFIFCVWEFSNQQKQPNVVLKMKNGQCNEHCN